MSVLSLRSLADFDVAVRVPISGKAQLVLSGVELILTADFRISFSHSLLNKMSVSLCRNSNLKCCCVRLVLVD